MGASGWDYVVPHQPDARLAFAELQRKVLAERDFYGEDDEYEDVTTLDELVAMKDGEEFWECGTHSILDMDRLSDAGQPDEAGAIRALSPSEASAMFGTGQPSRADFERMVADVDPSKFFPRWSGRYTSLYQNGTPDAIAFWGYSGD